MKRNILIALIGAVFCCSTVLAADLPPAPENFQYGWLYSEVLLTWNEVPEALGYNVYRFDDTSTNWVQIAAEVPVPRYRDVNSMPASYTVTAVNDAGEGAAAPQVFAQYADPGGPTLWIDDYESRAYDTIAILQWSVSLASGADGMLEAGPDMAHVTHFMWDTNYAGMHRLVLTNLLPGTFYQCRITSVGTNRCGATGWRTFTTPPAGQSLYMVNQNYTIWEDYPPFQISALARDGMYGPELPTVIVGGPTLGTAVSNGFQSFLYTPATNACGTDVIYFAATNSMGLSSTGTITIQIYPGNDPPVSLDLTVNAFEDTELLIAPQAYDVEGDPINNVDIASYPTNGWVYWNGSFMVYTPGPGFVGDDSFTYRACDNTWNCSYQPATVLIHVLQVNDPPVASNKMFTAHIGSTYFGQFPVGDPEGDPLICQIATGPASGTVTIDGANFTYIPREDASYSDSFTYYASDGQLTSSVAMVSIYIFASNNVPVATDQSITVPGNRDSGYIHTAQFRLDVNDPDMDEQNVILLTAPTNGTITFYGYWVEYVPGTNVLGFDSFTYQPFDGCATGNVVTVTFEILPNRPPVADSQTITFLEDWWVSFGISGSDPDGDPITYTLVSGPSHGTLQFTLPYLAYYPAGNWSGTDSFTFTVNDDLTNGNVATVTFNVTAVNDTPFVTNATIRTRANLPISFHLGAYDVEGSPLTYDIVPPTNGVLSGTAPDLTYTPALDWTGTNTWKFRVSDGELWSAWANVTNIVTPGPNHAPTVTNQDVSVYMSSTLTNKLNGFDPDGDSVTFTILSNPTQGTLSGSGSNFVYTPTPGYIGTDSFLFAVCDNFGACSTGAVNISVLTTNRAPVGQNKTISVPANWLIQFGIYASDPNGDYVTYRIVTPPAHGTLRELAYQNYEYRGNLNYNGYDNFTWVANDGQVDSPIYTVTIVVGDPNHAPWASNTFVTVLEDTNSIITPNAGDIDGDPLTLSILAPPTHGTAYVNGGTVVYTPVTNYNGSDSIQYQVRDQSNKVASAYIYITVQNVIDLPRPYPQTITIPEDTAVTITPTITNVDNLPLYFEITRLPINGSVVINSNGTFTYTPAANFSGTNRFFYDVTSTNGILGYMAGIVTIIVTPVNDPPVANAMTVSTAKDTSVAIILTGSDVEGNLMTFQTVSNALHGTITGSDSHLVYTPAAGYSGTDSFMFRVYDGQAYGSVATVTINVSGMTNPPTAKALTIIAAEDTPRNITLQGAAPDGQIPVFSILTAPSHGALSGTGSNLVYTPALNYNGTDSFVYQVADNWGNTASASVIIMVTSVNDPPTASPVNVTVAEDWYVIFRLTPSDAEGENPTCGILTLPQHGTNMDLQFGRAAYIPATNYNGPDSFLYWAQDSKGLRSTGVVSIIVTPVNDPLWASNQTVNAFQNALTTITPTASDIDGDPLTFSITAPPTHGTATVHGGKIFYLPETNYLGLDSFQYQVSTPDNQASNATVTINVAPLNDLPPAPQEFKYGWLYSEVLLTWNEVPGATAYNVYCYDDTNSTWVQIAAGLTVPRYRDANTNATIYTVTAVNAAGEGPAAPPVLAQDAWPWGGPTLTFPDPSIYDTLAVFKLTSDYITGGDAMVEAGTNPTNLTYFVWQTNYAGTHELVVANLLPETDYYFRFTSVGTNRCGTTFWRTYTTRPAGRGLDVYNVTNNMNEDGGTIQVQGRIDEPYYPYPSPATFIVGGPSHGTAVNTGFQTFLYTPATNFFGTDMIYFAGTNVFGIVSTGTITIVVSSVNDPPWASNQTVTVIEDTPTTITPITGDIEGDSLNFYITTSPAHGTATVIGGNIRYTPDANFFGTDSFQYQAIDGGYVSATATITVNVTNVNDPPVAEFQTITTPEDTPIDIFLTATDPDHEGASFDILTPPAHGTFGILIGPQPYTYRPDPNYNGTDSFTFRARDSVSASTGVVSIIITPVNDRPTGSGHSVSTAEDTPVAITLTASDVEGVSLTFRIVNNPLHGSLSGTGSNLVYTPAANYNGTESFDWVANDGQTDSPIYTVALTITPINDAPWASNQTVTVTEDTPTTLTPNTGDVDGDPLILSIVIPPIHGTATVNGSTILYTPETNFAGSDWMQYEVRDLSNQASTATINILVQNVNDPPVATPVNATTPEDTAVTVTLSASDPDLEFLHYDVITEPAHGTLTRLGDATFVYTPAANYNGPDSFIYRAMDPSGYLYLGTNGSSTNMVSISVTPVNDAPVANPQNVTTPEDAPISITLTGSDVENDALTFALVSAPTNGVLTTNGAELLYTPNANYNGSDSFSFVANDGLLDSAPATVSINVTPVNDAPMANAQSLSTPEDTPIAITLTGSDLDGDGLTYAIVNPPTYGTLTGSGANLVYTPAPNYYGPDSFTFQAYDGEAYGNVATVSITVTSVNDAPVADAQAVTTSEDTPIAITLTGSDIEGDALSFALVSSPTNGVLTTNGTDLVYTPNANFNGRDSFSFVANDGSLDSAPATVSITVTAFNDAPVALAQELTTPEDASLAIILTGVDLDGDTLTYTILTQPAHGTLTGSGANYVYTPGANYSGPDSFTFKVSDGFANSGVASVTITVTPVNDPPVANPASASTAYNTPVNIALSGSDIEGSPLTYRVLAGPTNATVTVSGATLTYAPIGATGTMTFTYVANDGELDSAPATVTVTVSAPTSKPANPNGLTAVAVSSSQINITWKDNATNEDGYKIERSTDNKTWTEIDTVPMNTKTYSATGLLPNKTYYFRVRAWNVLGYSNYSNTKSAKTLP